MRDDWLADQFEQTIGHRPQVTYRLLGSGAEAEDGQITEMALIADTDGIARREWKLDNPESGAVARCSRPAALALYRQDRGC